MKKIISLLLCAILIIPSVNVAGITVFADNIIGNTVSTTDELKLAIENANDGDIIYLKGGNYVFSDTFNIENVNKNITICSVEGETAVFTTADKVTDWEECKINGVDAFCASAKGKTITSLFSDGNELQRARIPESGFYYLDKADTSDTVGSGDSMGTNGFYVHDINYELSNPEDICVGIVHWWVNELSPMVSFDLSTGLIKTEKYTGLSVKDGDRYYLENVKESVDKAGEWCYDSSEDKIYYVPKNGETVDNVCVYASSQAEMIKINNCSGITFENIEFAETAFTYGDEKYLNTDIHTSDRPWKNASFQSATDSTGAVIVTYSDNINFENCEFRNIGCTAVRYFNGAKNCKIDSCVFDKIGASAVFAGGKFLFHSTQENKSEDYAENITVTNCEIKYYGQKFYGASGLTIAYCDTADISHNEIHDGYYTGISVGYCWLFFDNPTQYISVKDNLIYNIGNKMISDLGGIYLLGVQEGTVVSGNVIHDVTCYDGSNGYAGCGIYLDSGCEFMTIEKNLVFNCDTSGYNNTLNKNNTVRNNIFALCGQSSVSLGTIGNEVFTEQHSTYYNNIILTDNGVPAVEYLKTKEHFCGNNNIVYDLNNDEEIYFCEGYATDGKILKETAQLRGYLSSCVFTDPGFVNAGEYDFTFTENSYAVNHGFEPIDYDNAGTLKDTVIGFDTTGGQTSYNGTVNKITEKNINLNFIEYFKKIIYKIVDVFKEMFSKIKGLTETVADKISFTSYFEKRNDNDTTKQLEKLFDEVKTHTPTYRVDESRKPYSDDDRIQAIYFTGEKCNGKDTEVFAYLGIPDDATVLNPASAVVLVHGGGQHAQADWVKYWVDKGYAAIAIDGFGQEPLTGEYSNDSSNWVVNPDSHITYTGFEDCDNKLSEQWFYFYISDIILANNILRADSRVAVNEIGVCGISWGGMATSVTMGYDNRFAFAIPIYGCPYADCSNASSLFIKDSADIWEASLRLSDVEMPVFYVNGNDDPFFSANCTTTAASYTENGSMVLLDDISHGKFNIEETVRFANEVTGNGYGNIHITGVNVDGNNANIAFTVPYDVKGIKVKLYTKTSGFDYNGLELIEDWDTTTCISNGKTAKVTIPDGTEYYYFEVTGYGGSLFDLTKVTATTGVFTLK